MAMVLQYQHATTHYANGIITTCTPTGDNMVSLSLSRGESLGGGVQRNENKNKKKRYSFVGLCNNAYIYLYTHRYIYKYTGLRQWQHLIVVGPI